jgi:2-desacetyl-2-hydroxyethyl bacteriochlorophyllide A dehydrogenase
MKAVVIHGPSQVSIDDVKVKQPGLGEVLIKVKAAGLCGTDYELYTNDMVYINEGLSKLPIIPGHEWSGVVEKTGEGVENYKPGDKVTGECTVSCGKCYYCQRGKQNQCINRTETGIMNRDGGFAEYITFPVSHLHKFKTLSFEEASLIEPTGIGLYATMRGNVTPFDNVMVTGPGPVGLKVAQIAKKVFNAKRVILTGTRDERLDRAKNYGIEGCINIRKEEVKEKVTEITHGEMIDVVIEESGGTDVFEDIKQVINPCGRIVLNGFFGSKKVVIDWDFITVNDIKIIGSLGSPNIWDDVIEMLESGKIETKSLISHVIKLEEFEKGLDIMVNRKENACKVILKP